MKILIGTLILIWIANIVVALIDKPDERAGDNRVPYPQEFYDTTK